MRVDFVHVALNCEDLGVIERFYTKHFGFRRARVVQLGDDQILFIKAGCIYMELFKAKEERPIPRADRDGPVFAGLRHIAFQVDDLDAKLEELGDEVKLMLGPMEFDDFIVGWRSAWVADPEGNIIEISQGYVDQENPPPFDAESTTPLSS
jgi:glyoxylase I family protein